MCGSLQHLVSRQFGAPPCKEQSSVPGAMSSTSSKVNFSQSPIRWASALRTPSGVAFKYLPVWPQRSETVPSLLSIQMNFSHVLTAVRSALKSPSGSQKM
eukprot:CAMPEP_0115490338 /NCGR_PEP_ID=MMETSP0271-20121206/62505_1 /TAXON_ID=71861 /ORGANISM="Scrippsiella trochoidea, Strain CCMP3099" /LENGTH=99 /DNA_ID=CAMNT_0002918587 /DNA_START=76 /DNA_END=375 /DNA_ORIENTATION=+